ncbi:MAG: hypothetical protein IKW26_07215 [Treponema sp.]|nr:hypothetical protein [Treponema sp.]
MIRNHFRKVLRDLSFIIIVGFLGTVAFIGCDSGLIDNPTNGDESQGGSGIQGAGTEESPLWSRPATKKLYGISSITRGDDNEKYLVKAVDDSLSKGTGTGTVGVDSFHDTNRYRIPSATVIPGGKYAGRLLVISDSRFGSRADLPAKASTWVRYSDDHGKNWSNIATVSDFDDTDMSQARAGMNRMSVSTGDSAIGADSNGYVYAISSFVAPMTGNFFGGKADNVAGSPYVYIDGEWYLRLRKNDSLYESSSNWDSGTFTEKSTWTDYVAESNNGRSSVYVYAAPVKGGQLRKLINNGSDNPTLGESIPVWIDEYYYLYTSNPEGGSGKKLEASQLKAVSTSTDPDAWGNNYTNISINSSKKIHQHLFMPMSPYQVWRGGVFLGMTRSTDGGQTWEKTKDITYMTNKFIAANTNNQDLPNRLTRQYVCPTRGVELENGSNKGKVVFAIYMVGTESTTDGEAASFVWTADKGETWKAATSFTGGTKSQHKGETAIVEAPDGDIILISRNVREGSYRPTYSVTNNFGSSWVHKGKVWTGDDSPNNPLYSCGNLISAINLRFTTDILGNPLVAFSTDSGGGNDDKGRKDGRLWIASLIPDGDSWKFEFNCNLSEGSIGMEYGYPSGGSSSFHYSSLAETFDGQLFSAYEGSAWAGTGGEHGGPVIDYAFFTLNRR